MNAKVPEWFARETAWTHRGRVMDTVAALRRIIGASFPTPGPEQTRTHPNQIVFTRHFDGQVREYLVTVIETRQSRLK